MSHFNAGDVRDGIEHARRSANRQLEVTLPRLLRLERNGENEEGGQQSDGCMHVRAHFPIMFADTGVDGPWKIALKINL